MNAWLEKGVTPATNVLESIDRIPFFLTLATVLFFYPHCTHTLSTTSLAMAVIPLFFSCSFSPRGATAHAEDNEQQQRCPIIFSTVIIINDITSISLICYKALQIVMPECGTYDLRGNRGVFFDQNI